MVKAVFTAKPDSAYDDALEHRYHFPRAYLRQVQDAVGDWIVYYEPRRLSRDVASRGGRQAYFATARLERIERDPADDELFYGYVADYLAFDEAVSFRQAGGFYEAGLMRPDGATSKGAFGRAVRPLSEVEYEAILAAGFGRTFGLLGARPDVEAPGGDGVVEPHERRIVERLSTRPFRDAAFRQLVTSAYDSRCAMTGLRIIAHAGRSEVQAAHIRPVAHGGSDSPRNGLALSGTVHWMFDQGLVSVDADHAILTAESYLPPVISRFLRDDRRRISLPTRRDLHPHPDNLRYHRHEVFRG